MARGAAWMRPPKGKCDHRSVHAIAIGAALCPADDESINELPNAADQVIRWRQRRHGIGEEFAVEDSDRQSDKAA